ncbi:MAG: hypothetical protein IPJ25_07195 [Rhodocyclaceae bacterium]|nr:hypothetical protein [Rhodocyclaceae bacterium]
MVVANSTTPLWLAMRTNNSFYLQQWDAASGKIVETDLPLNFNLNRAAQTSNGLLIFGEGSGSAGQVALLMADKTWLSTRLLVARARPRLLVLRDQSVLFYSGKAGESGSKTGVWSLAIERVSFDNGSMRVERLPDLPGPVRNAFTIVGLLDGRVMALGGTAPPYIGCMPCYAETYFLDLKQQSWIEGPPLLEARSDASATLLPNGSVMIAGGWTPKHDWSTGPTRSVEIWRPMSARFEPAQPLPSASAMHRVQWMPGQEERRLLLSGGNNSSLQVYDLASDHWRVVGEGCQGEEKGQVVHYPFVRNGQAYAWISNDQDGLSCEDGNAEDTARVGNTARFGKWSLIRLRTTSVDSARPVRIEERFGLPLYRAGMALAPSGNGGPALAVGGWIHAGMNAYEYSAAVDAIWPDGRIQAMPALNQARSQALALTLKDNSRLVLGGRFGDRNARENELQVQTAEWLPGKLPLDQARWISLENEAAFSGVLAAAALADGRVVVLANDHNLRIVSLHASAKDPVARPQIETQTLPPLGRARVGKVTIKGLTNGRIVVAGGQVQVHKIALLDENSEQSNAKDEYVGIGEFLPSYDYDIFDPAKNTWRTSVPSRAGGENAVILDDGRVMKLGVELDTKGGVESADTPTREHVVIELSSADGMSWTSVGKDLELGIEARDALLFELQGEVFLTAKGLRNNTGGGATIVQWLSAAEKRWQILWEAGPGQNWRAHTGRVIVRQLPNGKRVVLPVTAP